MKFKEWLKLSNEKRVQFDIDELNDMVVDFVQESPEEKDRLNSNERTSLYLLIIQLVTAATIESPDKGDKKVYIHTLCSILSQPLSLSCSTEDLGYQKYYDRCVGALEVLEANIESFKVLFAEMEGKVYVPEQKIITEEKLG